MVKRMIPLKMKAAVYYAAGDVRIESVETPTPEKNQVLLRVLRSGMCGTDASEFKSGPKIFAIGKTHEISGHHGPMILGHEFIGEIVQTGADVNGFAVGDQVATGAGYSCGNCSMCKNLRTNLCEKYVTSGLNRHGGMAEYAVVEDSTLEKIPAGLSLDIAGLAQPLSVGIHAARRAQVASGDHVILIGAGAIGTFVLAGLKHLVTAEITVVDFAGERLERATRIGADHTFEVTDNTESGLRKLFPTGADVVIEASGAPGQVQMALNLVRRGGTLLQVGLPSSKQELDVHTIVMSEKNITTTLAHVCSTDLGPALEILKTTQLGHELLEGVFPLEEISDQLAKLNSGQIQGKVLFDPTL
jgi:(R,R)-butanediol dehydrogenase/meso-butanediol dehydrogenase/diacetyl reductase